MKFKKKPVVIDAIRWTGDNLREVICFTDGPPDVRSNHASMKWEEYCDLVKRDGLKIFTLEGKMSASVGDWIIRGVEGEHYPCKPDIFAKTYELAEQTTTEREGMQAATKSPRCAHRMYRCDKDVCFKCSVCGGRSE